jgi:hypothetical protein
MKLASCLLVPLLVASSAALTACTAPPDTATGTLTLDLVGTAPSGTQYRLRDAKILVRGPDSTRLWDTEDMPDRTSLSADVSPGDYTAAVQGGWRLERLAGASATPVAATLVSDNPARFTVAGRRRTAVPLRFRVDGDVVDMTQGYDITITVDEPRSPVIVIGNSGNFDSDPPLQRSITVYPSDGEGDLAPLRTIAGPRTTLSDPIDLVVAGDRIIVSDVDAIDVFLLSASGDVAPTTRIAGPSTGLVSAQSIAVSNGEIYAVQNDQSILVFPLTASGDVPPSRRITSPWLNPFHTVIDHGEIYVLDSNPGFEARVLVFPASTDGAVLPTRTLRWAPPPDPLAIGLAIRGDELFVATESSIDVLPAGADGPVTPLRSLAPISGVFQIAVFHDEIYAPSFTTNRVMVFPADASGSVAPTRTIAGPSTHLDGPIGVSVN